MQMASATEGDPKKRLLQGLTPRQQEVVTDDRRRLLVVAGAGSGKTEVMSRRVAWWVSVKNVSRESIVAFTFTEKAAEEMKFRIRLHIQEVTDSRDAGTLGGMYVGTIHSFCLETLRRLKPDVYHNFDVIDEAGRLALVQRGYHGILGLPGFAAQLGSGQYAATDAFLKGYDLLNEYGKLDVTLPPGVPPSTPSGEADWCKAATLATNLGKLGPALAFSVCAARYYAYLRSRHFLDFSTSQAELLRLLRREPALLVQLRKEVTHLVVDEVQDVNPVQYELISRIIGSTGRLTAVGDHRQAIFNWRGGRVELMADLYEELDSAPDGTVIELQDNFRSTPRIITVANRWARTIGRLRSMSSPDMQHGNKKRTDFHQSHIAALAFQDRASEARWIAATIRTLVRPDGKGASHDTAKGSRGLSYGDIAVLVRSTTDVRTYTNALEEAQVPVVVRAGPDLFSQPEVLLLLAALARAAGLSEFFGVKAKSLPARIRDVLGCNPKPDEVIQAAARELRRARLPLAPDVEDRLLLASDLICQKLQGQQSSKNPNIKKLKTSGLREWLGRAAPVRRVFPQTLYHWLLSELDLGKWDQVQGRGATAMFHLGQFSTLVTGIETPGWTAPGDFKYQVIALYLWGAENARTEEAPLLVQPDAVSLSTIHSAKGLEFAAVFLADVVSGRFPSNLATRPPSLPFDGPILKHVNPAHLADNSNRDYERRLMYVAATRAERHLFISSSGRRQSEFFTSIASEISTAGGTAGADPASAPTALAFLKSEFRRDVRLVTTFSDLRYYLECPHDFYLRKVLGFAPAIDQAFGYGRGVHNLMRAVHTDPSRWAKLAKDPSALQAKLQTLLDKGMFYLRYTTGDPLERMRGRAKQVVGEYVGTYANELERLQFEPEREFETLIEDEQTLVSGAIDVIRLDDPPRVTIIDFKSGEADSDLATRLDEGEMRLQIGLYGLAAKRELQYEPDRGVVRYLGEDDPQKRQVDVSLDQESLTAAVEVVRGAARNIRDRRFHSGPTRGPRSAENVTRCQECDFGEFCGRNESQKSKGRNT